MKPTSETKVDQTKDSACNGDDTSVYAMMEMTGESHVEENTNSSNDDGGGGCDRIGCQDDDSDKFVMDGDPPDTEDGRVVEEPAPCSDVSTTLGEEEIETTSS